MHAHSNSKWLEIFVLLEANVNITNEELGNSSVKTCNLQLVYVCTITDCKVNFFGHCMGAICT